MFRGKKRAIMGIGTLIIFIATILVAAVAAGVLISTSGVLQQRALITGQEARKKITNAIEIISISAEGNKTDESLNNFDILVRLDAGSDPIQLKKFDISFIGENHDAAGKLADPTLNNPTVDEDGFEDTIALPLTNALKSIRDLDGDGVSESLYYHLDNSSETPNTMQMIVNFSDSDVGDAVVNFATPTSYPVIINESDLPIIASDGLVYGYFQLHANITSNASINSSGSSLELTPNFVDECTFGVLPPETRFCYSVIHGDSDAVLGDGEVLEIKYRMRHENRLYIGEEFRFIFSSEKGRLTSAQARTPDIIQTTRVPLWPVG